MTSLARAAFQLAITDEDGVRSRYVVAADTLPLAEHRLCHHLGISTAVRVQLERLVRSYDIERMNSWAG